jgi:hypothetical protein
MLALLQNKKRKSESFEDKCKSSSKSVDYTIDRLLSKTLVCNKNILSIPIQSMTSKDEYMTSITLNNDTRDFEILCTCGLKFTNQARKSCKHIDYFILSLLEKRNQQSLKNKKKFTFKRPMNSEKKIKDSEEDEYFPDDEASEETSDEAPEETSEETSDEASEDASDEASDEDYSIESAFQYMSICIEKQNNKK